MTVWSDYLKKYPDVAKARTDPGSPFHKMDDISTALAHYGQYGFTEGRELGIPRNVLMDAAWDYLEANPDVKAAAQSTPDKNWLDALTHYARHGRKEGRSFGLGVHYGQKAPSENRTWSLADVEPIPEPAPAGPYQPPAAYTPGAGATVEGRMRGLLSSESPYIRGARQRAREEANRRGLLNSSIAAGAGERAAIESALPIAQQDAAASHEAGMTGYQGQIEGALSSQAHGQDIHKIGEQARYSSLLSAQEAQQATALEVVKQEGANYRQRVEIEADRALTGMRLSSDEKRTASQLIADLGDSYLAQIANIQRDPNVSPEAKTKVIEQLRFEYEQNVESVAGIYGIELDWLLGSEGGSAGEGSEGAPGGEETGGGTGPSPDIFSAPGYQKINNEIYITNPLEPAVKVKMKKVYDKNSGKHYYVPAGTEVSAGIDETLLANLMSQGLIYAA